MKRVYSILLVMMLVAPMAWAKKEKKPQEVDSLGHPIKTGWNFGVLPSVAYDADLGFQGGALGNIYYYGDGKQYPEYIHSIYFEVAYTTKHNGIARLHYDSKYLIPNHRLTMDVCYLPSAMCDFYGFNGYQSVYNSSWHTWNNAKKMGKMDAEQQAQYLNDYQSRVFYKYKRDLLRVAADLEGTIYKGLKWNAGIGVLGYMLGDCDIQMLNGKKNIYDNTLLRGEQKALDSDVKGLYRQYIDWGLIDHQEKNGGWHPYARAGITYDTRDQRMGPTRGIYADAFFTYNAAFNSQHYGQQAAAGYNNLQFNFTFRQYISLGTPRAVFAYRVGTQNVIAGRTPFYQNNYLNTLFIQRMYYEGLGGGNSLRGVMMNRINADGFLYATAEFRFRVANFDIGRQHFFIAMNPFMDMGMVTQTRKYDEMEEVRKTLAAADAKLADSYFTSQKRDVYRPHLSAGLGLKVGMNENFVLSLDWAMPFDKQDNAKWANFYIKMGYIF